MKLIETGVDRLVKLISQRKSITAKDAAKELGVSLKNIREWAEFLEEEGIINLESGLTSETLVEKKLGKKELAEKVKAAKGENEAFVRKVESSINALKRDSDELKLIDSEFKHIKTQLQQNFEHINKKLKNLEDHNQRHKSITSQRKNIESNFEKKLNSVDEKLRKEQHLYSDVLTTVNKELEQIEKERGMIKGMKKSEDALSLKLDNLNNEIIEAKSHILHGNKMLEDDEVKLSKAEEKAKKVKNEILGYRSELDSLTKDMKNSRKEMEEMEKEFIDDVRDLESGDLGKIKAIKESRELIKQIEHFFSKTKEIEKLIEKAEQEEKELQKHFENMAKKAQAFHVIATKKEVKEEIKDLQVDLKAIEDRKKLLGGQLKKLRTLFRGIR